MKKSKGKCLIWLGLLLMAAALCLTGYNVWDAFRAEKSVRQTADRLEALISPAPEPQPENTLPVHRLGVPGRSGHRSPQLREPLRAAEGAGPRR